MSSTLPFRFTADGAVTFSPGVPAWEGVRVFVSRYVREWVLWHRAGSDDLSLCDLAALRVAVIHGRYLGENRWKDARHWLTGVLALPEEIDFMEFHHEEIPAATLEILRLLRPSTWTLPGAGKRGGLSDPARAAELLTMACPAEHFLVLGGDNRLTLDPGTLLNGYGCRPWPRPEAVTFASSTATSISAHAFQIVEERRQAMVADAIRRGVSPAVKKLSDEVRRGIGKRLGLVSARAQIVLSSSGTDTFLVNQGLIRLVADAPLISLMVGADESGTGVPLAAQERHFAVKAALGHPVEKGERLGGCANHGGFVEIFLHDPRGGTFSPGSVDRRVRKLAEESLATGAHVVIHAMNHSKLGRSGPSPRLLRELKKRFGDRLHVVVDACQMRLDLDELRGHLDHGFLVIITGSKFFTGPPLSGAVLVPRRMIKRVLAVTRPLPESFNAYCATYDLPPDLRKIRAEPGNSFNPGSYFRWVAALAEMKRYFRVPARLRRKALDDFCQRVEKRLRAHACIELQDGTLPGGRKNRAKAGELSGRRMIFAFFLHHRRGRGKQLCREDQVRMIYTLLNEDCSGRFASANAREYRLLAQRCHIGQPVPARHRSGRMSAVLRLSVGARVVSESWSESSGRIEPDLIDDETWQVSVVLDKIGLLLDKIAEGVL